MSKYINKTVIKERDIEIRTIPYKEITYDDGEVILKRYDKKTKMWVVLRFTQNEDTKKLNELDDACKKIFLDTI